MKDARQHPSRPNIWVTPDGRVFQELAATRDGNNYALVNIGERGLRGSVRRHVLVCETYHGERPGNAVVRHKNGVPGDDWEGNLEWGSQKENCEDTVAHGRSTKGMRNPNYRLKDEQVREIKQRLASGEAPSEIARWFGVSQPTISDIKTGRTWSHITLDQ